MSTHHFAFNCPHCTATIAHRGELILGVADCRQCGAQFRIDVHVINLRGPQIRDSQPGIVSRDPYAPFASLIGRIMSAEDDAA